MLRESIKKLFAQTDIQLNKHWGQNFLISQKIAQKFADLAELTKEDIILEIGPGLGIITKYLASQAKKVIAVEKDKRLIPFLRNNLKGVSKIKIINADIRNLLKNKEFWEIEELKHYKIVANLPFYLSTFFLRKVFELKYKPKLMVLGLQQEIVKRILAKPPKMSFLGMMTRLYGLPEPGPIVKKENFWPRPKVDAQILVIREIQEPKDLDAKQFLAFVKQGFLHPRKKLLGNLSKELRIKKMAIKELFEKIGLSDNTRAQELGVEEWKKIWKEAKELTKE